MVLVLHVDDAPKHNVIQSCSLETVVSFLLQSTD